MTEQDNGLPTIEEELVRKSFTELESLLLRRDQEKITEIEYQASINALFAICSGLVGDEFFAIISAASEEVRENDYSFSRKRVFRKKDKIYIMSTAANKDAGFPLIVLEASIVSEKNVTGDEEEVRVKVEKLLEKLESVGFEELK